MTSRFCEHCSTRAAGHGRSIDYRGSVADDLRLVARVGSDNGLTISMQEQGAQADEEREGGHCHKI